MKTIVVVDCQNDFITGTLACINAENAVKEIIKLIDETPGNITYSCDWHSPENKSFEINGGIWPIHCVANTWGAELSKEFDKIKDETKRPNKDNIYKKGIDDEVEEYSAFYAKNEKGKSISEIEADEFIVCGIASEFCVRETVLELLKDNKNVSLFTPGLGYVNEEEHLKNIEELKSMGAKILQ